MRRTEAIARRWESFWFAPTSTAALGAFRAIYGLVLALWALSLVPDAGDLVSGEGVLARADIGRVPWGPLSVSDSPTFATAAVGLLVVTAVGITVGYRSRLLTVIGFVLLVSIQRANPWMIDTGDELLRNFGFLLMLAPSGAALSLDRWRHSRDSFWASPDRSPWALRLLQLHVSAVYLFSAVDHLRASHWTNGTAVVDAMQRDDLARFDIPSVIRDSDIVARILTNGILAVEVALAVFLWHHRTRRWALIAGVGVHLVLEAFFELGFLNLVLVAGYLAFIPSTSLTSWLSRVPTTRRIAMARFGR